MPRFTKFMTEQPQKKVSAAVIIWAIANTLTAYLFFFVFCYFLVGDRHLGFISGATLFLIWVITYPFVGKLISLIIEILCNAIDKIYSLENSFRFGRWSGNTSLLVASVWPIVLPMIFVCVIAIVYGALFQHLYGIGEK